MKKETTSPHLQAIALLCNQLPDFNRRSTADQLNFLYEIGLPAADAWTVLTWWKRLQVNIPGLADILTTDFCSLGWRPNAYTPVFWGYEHISRIPEVMAFTLNPALSDAAIQPPPVDMRVYFPSLDGSPQHAELLKDCGAYPLVLFIHGQCEENPGSHYLQWHLLPMQLARCGYVVVVPSYGLTRPFSEEHLDLSKSVIHWMRTQWRHRHQLAPASQTALIGHSYGAIVAGRLATQVPCAAYVSLSGEWVETVGGALPPPHPLGALQVPALFMWGTGEDNDANLEGPNASLLDAVKSFKYSLSFAGANHFDYLPSGTQAACGGAPGPCHLVGHLAAAFTTLFLGKFLPTGAPVAIGDDLHFVNPAPLTDQQHFYQGGHLVALTLSALSDECRATLQWLGTNGESGSRNVP